MLSSNARSLFALPRHLPSHPHPSASAHSSAWRKPLARPRAAGTALLVLIIFLLLSLATNLHPPHWHPALLPLSPTRSDLHRNPSALLLPVRGNWRHLLPLLPNPARVLHVPRAQLVPLPSDAEDPTDQQTQPEPEQATLFLAPDALAQEPEMTLDELEAWALAYVPPPLTAEGAKADAKRKVKAKRGTKRRSARRMVNQD
ncbi:hypothetical protein CALVIDRAFT_537740 [Calocera viscosa TUFC12733]|uniref:Uncharacterized protein n=1 Tax=Calocera viscosa (strain TUFC12733) TaxID=1330018 RepID=A0A167LJS2_CALVF|nr:hypothetical protein CALVIDRAFT_537740 [Calocera viscosa TUFC12733]